MVGNHELFDYMKSKLINIMYKNNTVMLIY